MEINRINKKEGWMTMAGTMIHLVIAVRIAENIKKNGYKIRLADGSNIHFDKNMFIAGNMCPWWDNGKKKLWEEHEASYTF